MRRLTALLLLAPAIAIAKSPFDGVWRLKLDSMQFSGKPDVEEIKGGNFTCSSCRPPFTIRADGTDQPTPVHNLRDHMSVKVINATTVEYVEKKDGRITTTHTLVVSADGNKLSGAFSDLTGDSPVKGAFTMKRVGPAAPGAHAVSGAWLQESMPEFSDAARITVLESTPGGLRMKWNGRITDAKFDGKEYPTQNDPDHTLVRLKKISDRQFEERDKREGKVYDIVRWTVSKDGKTIQVVDEDPVHGTKSSMVLEKQP